SLPGAGRLSSWRNSFLHRQPGQIQELDRPLAKSGTACNSQELAVGTESQGFYVPDPPPGAGVQNGNLLSQGSIPELHYLGGRRVRCQHLAIWTESQTGFWSVQPQMDLARPRVAQLNACFPGQGQCLAVGGEAYRPGGVAPTPPTQVNAQPLLAAGHVPE